MDWVNVVDVFEDMLDEDEGREFRFREPFSWVGQQAWLDVFFSNDIFPTLALTRSGSRVLSHVLEMLRPNDELDELLRPKLPALFKLLVPEENVVLLKERHGKNGIFPCNVFLEALRAAMPEEKWVFSTWFDMDQWEGRALALLPGLRLGDKCPEEDVSGVDFSRDAPSIEEQEEELSVGILLQLVDEFFSDVEDEDPQKESLEKHFTPEVVQAFREAVGESGSGELVWRWQGAFDLVLQAAKSRWLKELFIPSE